MEPTARPTCSCSYSLSHNHTHQGGRNEVNLVLTVALETVALLLFRATCWTPTEPCFPSKHQILDINKVMKPPTDQFLLYSSLGENFGCRHSLFLSLVLFIGVWVVLFWFFEGRAPSIHWQNTCTSLQRGSGCLLEKPTPAGRAWQGLQAVSFPKVTQAAMSTQMYPMPYFMNSTHSPLSL